MENIYTIKVGEQIKEDTMKINLANMKEFVGGYIECVRVTDKVDMWLNEEGKLDNLAINVLLISNGKMYDTVHGDIFFASHDNEGNSVSLTDDDKNEIISRLGRAIIKDSNTLEERELYTINMD